MTSDVAVLAGAEAHHLLHVLRAERGTRVVLFDGSGAEYDAEVTSCSRTTVDVRIVERHDANRELPFSLTLGVPLPKGDRQRWVVEKAVELGVAQLVPLVTARSGPGGERLGDKLHRYVIEASKQCGRNRLMHIAEPRDWVDWLHTPAGDLPESDSPRRQWIAHPGGGAVKLVDLARQLPTWIAVGPEGGLTDAEVDAALAAGWQAIGLGDRLLRIETAALALASLFATTACPTEP